MQRCILCERHLTHINVFPHTHTLISRLITTFLSATLGTCINLRNIKEINCNCVTEKRDRDQDRWWNTDSECWIIVTHLKASLSFSYFPKMTQTGWLSPCSEDSLSGGDVSPSSSTSCPLPCGILAPGCCKQAADPGLFFLSFLTATGSCLFQHSCVPLSPLVAGNNSMHTQVHQRKLPLTALQGHYGVCESNAPSFSQKV